MKKIFFIAVGLVWISCKNNNPASSAKPEEKKNDSISVKADTSVYRLAVLFFSNGEGIDGNALKSLQEKITSFSAERGKPIDYKKSNWGREGETDFVFRLSGLTDAEQAEFVNEVKTVLKSSKLVNIFENYRYHFRER